MVDSLAEEYGTGKESGRKKFEEIIEQIKKEGSNKKYDVIIIGGGGHGLATAFYLAKEFKIKNIAVLEKNWIGGGNVGRNTTIIRSN